MSGTGTRPVLSERLNTLADSVRKASAFYESAPEICDIGCDHALLGIDLLLTGDVRFVHAGDVREGPIRRAKENAASYGVADRMSLQCADGFAAVGGEDVRIAVIAGMGGERICEILQEGSLRSRGISCLVLSPHTKWDAVRGFLRRAGFRLTEEGMVEEDGKFYPVMTAVDPGERFVHPVPEDPVHMLLRELTLFGVNGEDAGALADRFGPVLMLRRDAVLLRFLQKRTERLSRIAEELRKGGHGDGGSPPETEARLARLALEFLMADGRRQGNEVQ